MQIVFLIVLNLLLSLFYLYSDPSSTDVNRKKTIAIFAYKDNRIDPWDPASIKTGMRGSEEAIVYISEKLAELGYQVTVLADPPENSPYSKLEANPRYVKSEFNDGTKYDIAISWRMPWSAALLKTRAHKVYLWPHDTTQCQLIDQQINGFDDVLWLSQWQRESWIRDNPGFAKFDKIFANGINPDQFKPIHERTNPYQCIYGSNYARGLEVLIDIWPKVKEKFPKAKLDVYYGWQHWGYWTKEKEEEIREKIEKLSALDVHEHGLVSHEELNRAYEEASLWTYPCTGVETFCISALRAQLAGTVPVIIDGSALKETVRHGFKCSTSEEYLATLLDAMQKIEKVSVEDRKKMGKFILDEFTWEAVAHKWHQLFSAPSLTAKAEISSSSPH